MIKKILLNATIFLAVASIFTPITVLAFAPTNGACTGKAASSPVCSDGNSNPISGNDGIILKVVKIILIAAGVLAILMIMLGGWAYITSQGDPQKLKGAKDTILYAIIGLVVAIMARAILSVVLKKI